MNRILLILLVLFGGLRAADIAWLGTTTSAKTAANWVGGVLPAEGDRMIFNADHVDNCTFDSNFTTAGIVGTGYTGTVSLQTYTITCTGDITLGGIVLSAGTSTLTLTGAAAQSITSAGETWYDITINRSTAGTCTFADAASAHTLTISATNTQAVSWTGTTMTLSGDLLADGSGTLNCGTAITTDGASSNAHFGSTLGTVTATSCALTMNGTTGATIDDDKSTTLKTYTHGANAVVTVSGASTVFFDGSGIVLTIVNGGSLTINAGMTLVHSAVGSSGKYYSITGSPTINGTATLRTQSMQLTVKDTLPAISLSGSLTFEAYAYYASASVDTVWQSGTFAMTSTNTFKFRQGGSATLVFITNDNAITGSPNIDWTAGAPTLNLGASAWQIGSLAAPLTTTTINFQTSTISCTGNWAFASTNTINPGTSTVRLTPGAAASNTITSAGKHFAYMRIVGNATGKVTLGDSLQCDSAFTDSSGKFNQNSKAIYAKNWSNYSPDTCWVSAPITVSGTSMVTGASALMVSSGTGKIIMSAGGTAALNACTSVPPLQINDNTTITGGATIARLSFGVDSKKATFAPAAYTLTAWDSSDFNGDSVVSETPGTRFQLVLPAADTLNHFYAKDCSTSVVVICDSTCRTGGNNRKLRFLRHLAISPATGSAAGGTAFTITGRGLIGGGALFGTASATSWSVASNLSATGVSPAGVSTVAVRVYSTDCGFDGDTVSITGGWTYISRRMSGGGGGLGVGLMISP